MADYYLFQKEEKNVLYIIFTELTCDFTDSFVHKKCDLNFITQSQQHSILFLFFLYRHKQKSEFWVKMNTENFVS